MIARGTSRPMVKKKAIELSRARHIFASGPVILTKEFRMKAVSHVPVIEEEELESMSRFKELQELIKERAREK